MLLTEYKHDRHLIKNCHDFNENKSLFTAVIIVCLMRFLKTSFVLMFQKFFCKVVSIFF